jgi:tripartite-type tricarboxylate transporter receptor subunit TctC
MTSDLTACTLIVPFPPGGSTDFTARILGERLLELGVAARIETVTGDSGYNAVRAVAAGDPDRVFLVGNINANSVAPAVRPSPADIDHWQVLRPVTLVAEFPSVICTHTGFPADSLEGFLARLKQTSGVLRYGTDFLGTYVDVDVIRLCERSGLERACMTADGALAILDDLAAERTDLAILNVATSAANRARLKPLAVTGPERLGNFPEVPTLDELGFAGIGTSNWQGLLASRRASPDSVAALHAAAAAALDDDETRRRFADVDARVAVSASPEEFAAKIEAEKALWERHAGAILGTPLL